MKIMVSACLLGQKCKYNGGDNFSEKVAAFCEGHEVIPVCPEVAGGLPVPRIPCEIVNGKVINKAGESKDREFRDGAEKCLAIAKRHKIDLAILQSRSPSCGVKQFGAPETEPFVMELAGLEGRQKLAKYDVESLIIYPGK